MSPYWNLRVLKSRGEEGSAPVEPYPATLKNGIPAVTPNAFGWLSLSGKPSCAFVGPSGERFAWFWLPNTNPARTVLIKAGPKIWLYCAVQVCTLVSCFVSVAWVNLDVSSPKRAQYTLPQI